MILYDVAMDSVIFTVAYNWSPVFLTYICVLFGKLRNIK